MVFDACLSVTDVRKIIHALRPQTTGVTSYGNTCIRGIHVPIIHSSIFNWFAWPSNTILNYPQPSPENVSGYVAAVFSPITPSSARRDVNMGRKKTAYHVDIVMPMQDAPSL